MESGLGGVLSEAGECGVGCGWVAGALHSTGASATGAGSPSTTASSRARPPGQGTAPQSLTGTLGVLVPVVIALLISIFFVTLFLLAFRSPTPHGLRVGVTGPTPSSGAVFPPALLPGWLES